MVEKIYDELKSIQEINHIAADLRKLSMKDELLKLAAKNNISKSYVEDYMAGKRYFLVDGGDTVTIYKNPRSKIIDEMFRLNEPHFGNIIGTYLLGCCNEEKFGTVVMQSHKTLQRCIEYLMEQAYGEVEEGLKGNRQNTAIAVRDDQVYVWIRDYYSLDDTENVEKKLKEAQEEFLKKCVSSKTGEKYAGSKKALGKSKHSNTGKQEKTKKVVEKTVEKKEDGQMSLFDAGMTA